MTIDTALTQMLALRHPLLQAPMAYVAGGALAAAVSEAGGLGLIGGGYGEPAWLAAQLAAARGVSVGVGFITWRLDMDRTALDVALAARPRAVLFSFGDFSPYVDAVRATGAAVLAQVQSVAQARAAVAAGAQVLIAQGCEAGGHAGARATLALVPAVVDAVDPLPVVAAGGIADGRGVAAALILGAAGAMLGTRFYASREALAHPRAKQALIDASGDDTVRGAVFDRLRERPWPPGYSLRALANELTRRYPGDASAVAADWVKVRAEYEQAVEAGDVGRAAVIVGEASDLVRDLPSAAELVTRLIDDSQRVLRGAARFG
jgi:nitronate monooxygenase